MPFRTQKDGSRWQTSNCGPATLGMLLDGYGISGQETDDLRLRMHTYQGTVGMRTGTGLEHVAHVAEDCGLATHRLYNASGSYHTWSLDDIVAELRQGRPVMPLVRLYLVPGYESLAPRWGHYILLTGITPAGFTFSDSLKTDPAPGTTGLISASHLGLAMGNSHIPGQAAAFGGPRPLPVVAPS
ncbi:MAG: C39 family peptidase [Chloroflexi bacterium]|nr:C39 family peptidase [Chloroflexota bacterium]